jgi:uncharacterized protein YkwD
VHKRLWTASAFTFALAGLIAFQSLSARLVTAAPATDQSSVAIGADISLDRTGIFAAAKDKPTAIPTQVASATPTTPPLATPTVTPPQASTATPTTPPSATPAATPTATSPVKGGKPTATPTQAASATPTRTPTAIPTATATVTLAPTPTATAPPVPTTTPTLSPTSTPTLAPTLTPLPTPTATTTPSGNPISTSINSLAFSTQVLDQLNAQRLANGCAPLASNQLLWNAAQRFAYHLASNGYLSHTGKDGSTTSSRVEAEGYTWTILAENVGAGYDTPTAIVTGWMNSPGHRANILNCALTQVGIGYYYINPDPNQVTNYQHYWVADFGTP